MLLANALDDLKRRGIRPKYIYTIPTVQNPTGTILPEARRAEMLKLAERMACRSSRTIAIAISSGTTSGRRRSTP